MKKMLPRVLILSLVFTCLAFNWSLSYSSPLPVKLQTNIDKASAAFKAGRLAFDQGKLADAEHLLKKAVNILPNKAEYHYWYGAVSGVQAQKANFFSKAAYASQTRKAFEKAVNIDKDYLPARQALVSYYLQAPGIMGGSNIKAKMQAQAIAKIDPIEGLMAKAEIAADGEHFEQALQLYEQAMAADSDNLKPRYQHANLLTQLKRFDLAMEMYQRIVAAQPNEVPAWYQIGKIAIITEDYLDEGEHAFNKYLGHQSTTDDLGQAWAHYGLGIIYQAKGKAQQAQEQFVAAKLSNATPNDKRLKQHLKKKLKQLN